MSQTTLEFAYAHDTDVGARPYQEDSVRVCQPSGQRPGAPVLAVLADGMGGHVAGEKASKVAIERYVDTFSSGSSGGGTLAQLLEHSLIAANDGIGTEIRKNPALEGMGCTLVAAYVDREGLRWASVGDSSLLLYRSGEVLRLNEDHSIGPLLDKQVQAKLMSPEDARNDPRRHALRSALTGSPIPLQEIVSEPEKLRHGDWVILASDGLETLQGDEIATVISRHRESGKPGDVVQSLLAEIRKKALPHQDNVSIIAIKVVDVTEAETRIIVPSASRDGEDTAPVSKSSETDLAAAGERHPHIKNGLPNALVLGLALSLIVLAVVLILNELKGPRHPPAITNTLEQSAPNGGRTGKEQKVTGSPASNVENLQTAIGKANQPEQPPANADTGAVESRQSAGGKPSQPNLAHAGANNVEVAPLSADEKATEPTPAPVHTDADAVQSPQAADGKATQPNAAPTHTDANVAESLQPTGGKAAQPNSGLAHTDANVFENPQPADTKTIKSNPGSAHGDSKAVENPQSPGGKANKPDPGSGHGDPKTKKKKGETGMQHYLRLLNEFYERDLDEYYGPD